MDRASGHHSGGQRKWIAALVALAAVVGVAPAQAQDAPEGAEPEVVVPSPVPTSSRPFTGDFDHVDRDMIFWYAPGDEVDRRWQGEADLGFAELEPDVVGGNYHPFTGDFNGDRLRDIFFYGRGSRSDSLWFGRSDDGFDVTTVRVAGTYRPVVGDFNGDGRTDIIWYKPAGG